MSYKTLLRVAVSVSVVAMLMGCAKAPQQDIDAAKSSLDAAKKAEADVYVPDQYNAASASLNQAMAEVEKQNSAFPLSRNYKNATQLLVNARKQADDALAAAGPAKEKVKSEVEAQLAAAQTSLTDAKALLAKAPKGKEGAEALTAINDDLTAVEASLTQATADKDAGSYMMAKDKIVAAQAKIASITQELNDAIAKKAGKKK